MRYPRYCCQDCGEPVGYIGEMNLDQCRQVVRLVIARKQSGTVKEGAHA